MSLTTTRSKALAGGVTGAVLTLALAAAAFAFGGDPGPSAPATVVAGTPSAAVGDAPATASQATVTVLPEPFASPATTAPAPPPAVPPTTAAARKSTTQSTVPTNSSTTAPPAPTTTVSPAKPAVTGQRVEYSTATVAAAVTALHQRIPLFAPTDPQLRAFADAVCASFDQGQSRAQVQATVRDAVSRIQGASMSDADAEFAVRTVTELRCPGYMA